MRRSINRKRTTVSASQEVLLQAVQDAMSFNQTTYVTLLQIEDFLPKNFSNTKNSHLTYTLSNLQLKLPTIRGERRRLKRRKVGNFVEYTYYVKP